MINSLNNTVINYKDRDFHIIHVIKNSATEVNEECAHFDSLLLAYSEEWCEKQLYIMRVLYRHYLGGDNIILDIPKVEKANCIIK